MQNEPFMREGRRQRTGVKYACHEEHGNSQGRRFRNLPGDGGAMDLLVKGACQKAEGPGTVSEGSLLGGGGAREC